MHITRTVCAAVLSCLLLPAQPAAAEVYTWKTGSGSNSYSDVPRNLKASGAATVNVRTRTVSPPSAPKAEEGAGSLSEQQKQLNDAISQENRKVEEQNKKIEEQNRRQQEDNCKTARLNRQFAETARVANREEFVKRYDADIARFCN